MFKLGANDFVKKPFDNLETAIGDAIARRLPSTERTRTAIAEGHALTPFSGNDFIVTAGGQSSGVLLDVAELWELYVISVLREAAHPRVVAHGTHDGHGRDFLLNSEVNGSRLAELRPDAVVQESGRTRCVLDAKYKFLRDWPGPTREDLYQLGSYILRFGAVAPLWGALIYPQDPKNSAATDAELKSLGELPQPEPFRC